MMGERLVMQESLFYEFRLEEHVPSDHLLTRTTAVEYGTRQVGMLAAICLSRSWRMLPIIPCGATRPDS